MTAPDPDALSEEERAGLYRSLLRGFAQTAQDRLCAEGTQHAWGQWERTIHRHDIPFRNAHGEQMLVQNQTFKISARRKCLNCGKEQTDT